MKLNLKSKARGFTMIELIIVIAILGILAVFALPRFGNFTANAKTAARDGVVASLNSAIGIVHAQWVANGSTGSVTLDGGSAITMTTDGYPYVWSAYSSAATCQTLVNALLSNVNGLTVGYSGAGCTINNTNWTTPVILTQTNAS